MKTRLNPFGLAFLLYLYIMGALDKLIKIPCSGKIKFILHCKKLIKFILQKHVCKPINISEK